MTTSYLPFTFIGGSRSASEPSGNDSYVPDPTKTDPGENLATLGGTAHCIPERDRRRRRPEH